MKIQSRTFSAVSMLAMGFVVILGYQNCGELRPSGTAASNQSSIEARYRKDKETITRVLNSTKFKVWMSAKDSVMETSNGLVTKVAATRASNSPLEVGVGSTGPKIVTSTFLNASVFEFEPGSSLITTSSDMPAETHYSMIALVEAPFSVGKLMSLRTASTSTSELALSYGSGSLKAMNYFDPANYATYGDALYISSGPMVVAISWNETMEDVAMQVNGTIVRATIAQTGTATDVGGAQRAFSIGKATFRAAEVMVVAEALTQAELNSMSRYLGERWGMNNVIVDPSLEGQPNQPNNPDALPPEIKQIIVGNCQGGCHAGWSGYTLADFKAFSLVKAGDPLGSPFYIRLTGSEGTNANKNMPLGLALPGDKVTTVKNWIQGLK